MAQQESASEGGTQFGNVAEWPKFEVRQGRFLERFDRLRAALESLFVRPLESQTSHDRLVFFAGHRAVDDFLEIFLLCANAEALAAEKLLRSMFEGVTDLLYLRIHPEEVDAYLDYYWVLQRKYVNAQIQYRPPEGHPPANQVAVVQENYLGLKDKYQVTDCKKCGTTRPTVSWSKKDLVTKAVEVGLQTFLVDAYYRPLALAHSTAKDLIERLKLTSSGISTTDRLDSDRADMALCTAHGLLLQVVSSQIDHFGLDAAKYCHLVEDYKYIWDTCEQARPDGG